jgi:hypothetical protein
MKGRSPRFAMFMDGPFRRWETPDGIVHWTCRWWSHETQIRTLWCNVADVIARSEEGLSVDVADVGLDKVTCLDCIAGCGEA